MYKILIKYTSTLSTVYYRFYTIKKDEVEVEYATSNVDELKEIVTELIKKFGSENIRIVTDVTYNVSIGIGSSPDISPDTGIQEIFDDIYNETFGG